MGCLGVIMGALAAWLACALAYGRTDPEYYTVLVVLDVFLWILALCCGAASEDK